MPRDDLALRLMELSLRIERLKAALSGSLSSLLTEDDLDAIRGALARAETEKAELEKQLGA